MTTEKTYTPPPVTGYRTLTQSELDLMNEIKAEAEKCGELVARLRTRQRVPGADMPVLGLDARWISIGATDLQTGFMALVRAVAQPTTV